MNRRIRRFVGVAAAVVGITIGSTGGPHIGANTASAHQSRASTRASASAPLPRLLSLQSHIRVHDDDGWWDAGEYGESGNVGYTFLTTETVYDEIYYHEQRVDDEVRVELHVDAQVLGDGSVRVSGEALLYEGSTDTTDDLDGSFPFSFDVVRGEPGRTSYGSTAFRVTNTAERTDDWGDIKIEVKNIGR